MSDARNIIPLPPNATRLERAYVESGVKLLDVAIPIDALWDAWRCPAKFLPHLAYALSVDFWDDAWDEITKRKTIAASPAYHRRKGTRLAIEEALATLGIDYDLTEWWEVTPNRREGTARVLIPAALANAEALVVAARRLAYAAKPKSRAIFVGVGEWQVGTLYCGGPIYEDDTTVIEPYTFTDPNPVGSLYFGGVIHSDDTSIITGDAR